MRGLIIVVVLIALVGCTETAQTPSAASNPSLPLTPSLQTTLRIISPDVTKITTGFTSFTIIGETEPGAITTINGERANVSPNGHFQQTMQLALGLNTYLVEAEAQGFLKNQKAVVIFGEENPGTAPLEPTPTPTPEPTPLEPTPAPTPEPTPEVVTYSLKGAAQQYYVDTREILDEWKDHVSVAEQTSRIALSPIVIQLQEDHRAFEKVYPPSDSAGIIPPELGQLYLDYNHAMNVIISDFLAFMGDYDAGNEDILQGVLLILQTDLKLMELKK